MNIFFEDHDLEELILTGNNSRYKKYTRNKKFMLALARVYNNMRAVGNASQLASFSYLHYEKLAGTKGLSSVRVINGMVERVIFSESEQGLVITLLELNTNHYGTK